MQAYRRAEQKAKERRSLYKTLAVCAAVSLRRRRSET